jgi:hypothetical protein
LGGGVLTRHDVIPNMFTHTPKHFFFLPGGSPHWSIRSIVGSGSASHPTQFFKENILLLLSNQQPTTT